MILEGGYVDVYIYIHTRIPHIYIYIYIICIRVYIYIMALGKRAQIHSSESGFLGTRGKMDPGSQAARNMRTNGSKHLITGTFSHHQKFPAQRQTKPPMKCSSMSSISTSSFQHTNRFHLFPNPRIPKSHADPAARKPRAVGGNVNAASQVRHTYRLHCWPQVHKDGPS